MKKIINSIDNLLVKFTRSKLYSVLFFIVLFLFIFNANFKFPVDPDFGWHWRYGQELIVNHKLLTQDTFSHTFNGKGIYDHEWLVDAAIYIIYSHWSFFGLAIVFGLITSLAFFIPPLLFKGQPFSKSLLVFLSLMGLAWVLNVGARAQNLSFVLFSLLIVLLLKYRQSSNFKLLLAIPLIFLFWANVHLGFYVGLIFLLVFLLLEVLLKVPHLPDRSRKLKLVLILALIVFSSFWVTNFRPTPSGESAGNNDLWSFVKGMVLPVNLAIKGSSTGSVRLSILEWLPPKFALLSETMMYLLGIILCLSLYSVKPFLKKDIQDIILLAGLIYFAGLSSRNLPYFFLAFLPISLIRISRIADGIKNKNLFPYFNFLALVVLGVLVVKSLPKTVNSFLPVKNSFEKYCQADGYPCQAVEFIKKYRPQGQMLNPYNWGGFLIWQLPEYPVFIDGRVPGAAIFEEYKQLGEQRDDWEEILKKYSVEWAILEANSPLAETLKTEKKWQGVYKDEIAIVIVNHGK